MIPEVYNVSLTITPLSFVKTYRLHFFLLPDVNLNSHLTAEQKAIGRAFQTLVEDNLIWFVITGRNEVVAKVMFLHLSVILFTGGVCLSACWDTTSRIRYPPGAATPPPPKQTPPRSRPPTEADSGIWSMSGRYASYWNAFLYNVRVIIFVTKNLHPSK